MEYQKYSVEEAEEEKEAGKTPPVLVEEEEEELMLAEEEEEEEEDDDPHRFHKHCHRSGTASTTASSFNGHALGNGKAAAAVNLRSSASNTGGRRNPSHRRRVRQVRSRI